MQEDVRKLIRELLHEELGRLRNEAPAREHVREELVELNSDADLARFITRILQISGNARARADIESDRHVFRLANNAAGRMNGSSRASATTAAKTTRFDRSLFVEKDIKNLADGVGVVQVSQHARFTPLAKDELRRLGIKIERVKS